MTARNDELDNVDYTRKSAPEPDDKAEQILEILREQPGFAFLRDPVQFKRYLDAFKESASGTDTNHMEDARLRQESEAQLTREHDDKFWGGDPEAWRKQHFGKL
jgi:hypothetical protein